MDRVEYKILLLRLGVSQRELAQKLRYCESYVSQIIAGKRKSKRFEEFIQIKLYIAEKRGVNV